jgi:hypothetical protein
VSNFGLKDVPSWLNLQSLLGYAQKIIFPSPIIAY